jgi:hypothetical protein
MVTMTFEDLIRGLVTPVTAIPNTIENWTRVGDRDPSLAPDLSGRDFENFLADWIANNPYSEL